MHPSKGREPRARTPRRKLPRFAEVAIPVHVAQTFTYGLTPEIGKHVRPGARVLVPFGNKLLVGYVVSLSERFNPTADILEPDIRDARQLLDVDPLLTPEVLEVARWVSDYYAAPLGEVLKAALPAGVNLTIQQMLSITPEGRVGLEDIAPKGSTSSRAVVLRFLSEVDDAPLSAVLNLIGGSRATSVVRGLERQGWIARTGRARSPSAKAKLSKFVRLLPEWSAALEGARALTAGQQRIIDALQASGGELAQAHLLVSADVKASTIATLAKRGVIEIVSREQRRDPLAATKLPSLEEFELTQAQAAALSEIESALAKRSYGAFLLHGITGSGKTEIYIRAMRAALDQGRTAMMLVPEIALTPVFSRRLRAHFGDQVAIFHSTLTKGERFDEWNRLHRGVARVVIGTRSAVFAPISNLGLVVVDEEHETSYRQQESPSYNGRDVGIVRANKEGAVVILGSATPAIESFHNARSGKYKYLELPQRIADRPLARSEIVDMRDVFARHRRPQVFSEELLAEIEATHARGEQTIILLNRRGYSTFVLCRTCGESIHCPNCEVTLTFHRTESRLICHYCNHREPAPSKCPVCRGKYVYYIGEGTEQIEALLKARFPTLRIARLDRDTVSRRKIFERSILEFEAGELDMLVGTQMLAKGHDFPNVTLVGIVSVDAGLALPDFRAAERTFQLITQVAGRAGRGSRLGRVLIQTYHPEHYVLKYSCAQDYFGFYEHEIRYRRAMNYPPYVYLASILIHDQNLTRAQTTAVELKAALQTANADRSSQILGPAPAPLARLRGKHRIQILIKSRSRRRLREVADHALANASKQGLDMSTIKLEIDPTSLM